MDIDLIFKIAAIGIIVAVLNQLLIRSGREEQAMMTTLAGLIVVLMMVIQQRCTFSIHQVHFWVIAYEYFGHCRSCDFNCRFSHFNA